MRKLLGNNILLYGYVKPRVQWLLTEKDPQPTTPIWLESLGLCPSGTLVHKL